MPAYIVGQVVMRDPSWVEPYRARVPALVQKHGGRYLVRGGKMETLEGSAALPSSIVVLEFPSRAQARAFYDDPEYVACAKLRQDGALTELVLVDGLT